MDFVLKLNDSEEMKMKNMKKALAMLLALTMILALCACGPLRLPPQRKPLPPKHLLLRPLWITLP